MRAMGWDGVGWKKYDGKYTETRYGIVGGKSEREGNREGGIQGGGRAEIKTGWKRESHKSEWVSDCNRMCTAAANMVTVR